MLDLNAIRERFEQPGIDTLIEDACDMLEELEMLQPEVERLRQLVCRAHECLTAAWTAGNLPASVIPPELAQKMGEVQAPAVVHILVVRCKDCGAVIYADSQPTYHELLEIVGYAKRGHRVELAGSATIENCTCGNGKLAARLKLADLPVVAYELLHDKRDDDNVLLEMVRGRGVVRWAIRRRGDALGKTPINNHYFFQCESLPSSRNDDYYNEYRFTTPEEALSFWNKHRPHIIVTALEHYNLAATQAEEEPFEYHEPPPSLTPDNLGAGWPYDKAALEGDSHAAS